MTPKSNITLVSLALFTLSLATLSPPLKAQTAPDAGQSLRQLQERPLPLPPEQTLDLQLPRDDAGVQAVQPGGASLIVQGFTLSGNLEIRTEALLAQLADLTGQQLSLGELENAANRLTLYYRSQGYLLARAYIPAQTITAGVVRIEILEGRYGAIQVNNTSRLRDSALAPLSRLQPGDAVKAGALERALLLIDQRAGVATRALLSPGSDIGTTHLQVGVEPGPLFSGSLEYDNGGNRYTGADRLTLGLGVSNPLGLGDRLDLRLLGTLEDQFYYAGSYQLPLGRWGTSLGASYAYMEYELGKDFKDLDAHGTSRSTGLFINQPLIVSRSFSLNARLAWEHKDLTDRIDLFASKSSKDASLVRFSLDGNARDNFLGGGLTSFALSWTGGDLSLDPADRAVDDITARTHGSFNVISPSLVRLQRLSDRFSLLARLRGQWADGNLDGSEEIGLGGPYGVRAYPQGEAQGDEGFVANLELRYALTPQWQVSTFADHGRIRVNHSPWDSSNNHRDLGGAGLGASWASSHWRLDVTSAWRLGSKPQSDDDQSPRVWIQGAYTF